MLLQPLPKPWALASKSLLQKECVDGTNPGMSACGARSIGSTFQTQVLVNFIPEVGRRVKSVQFLGACQARAAVLAAARKSQKVELPHPGAEGKNARHRKTTQCMAKPRRFGVEVRQAQW